MKQNFPEVGYTPQNFVALVNATQMTNKAFMDEFDVSHPSFYKYRTGERCMSWKHWDSMYENVSNVMKSRVHKSKEVLPKNKSAKLIGLEIVNVDVEKASPDTEEVVTAYVSINGKKDPVKIDVIKLNSAQTFQFFELHIGKHEKVDAVKHMILNNLSKSENSHAEILLDIDRHASSIYEDLLHDISKQVFDIQWGE